VLDLKRKSGTREWIGRCTCMETRYTALRTPRRVTPTGRTRFAIAPRPTGARGDRCRTCSSTRSPD
jgi:hypothetical protein